MVGEDGPDLVPIGAARIEIDPHPVSPALQVLVEIAGVLFIDTIFHQRAGETPDHAANRSACCGGAADDAKCLGHCSGSKERHDARNCKRGQTGDCTGTCADRHALARTACPGVGMFVTIIFCMVGMMVVIALERVIMFADDGNRVFADAASGQQIDSSFCLGASLENG